MKKIVERFEDFLKFKNISGLRFTKELGISSATLSAAKKPNRDISRNLQEKIFNKYPELNRTWLLTGEGEMLNCDNIETSNGGQFNMVDIYNLDVAAGMSSPLSEVDGSEYIIRSIPIADSLPGDIGFYVTGNSMQPAYQPGSIIVVREVKGWREYFGYGNTFVILLNDGRRILKQITKGSDSEHVTAASINPEYPSEEVPKEMILKVWKVVYNLRSEGF